VEQRTPYFFLLALLVCATFVFGCSRPDRDCAEAEAARATEFGRLVIRTLGIDGRACHRAADGQVYCLSRTAENPRAITVEDFSANDRLRVQKGLFLCQEQGGVLGNCQTAQADGWDCDHYGSGPKNCHCNGPDACIALSTLPTCEGGSCGDCSVGECCCTAP
jgi:hypothetical protein